MDLALFFRVVWRFKVLVLLGLSLAFALAFLSFVKVDFANGLKMTYREHEQWESLSTLFVKDPDFTLGSASQSGPVDPEVAAAASQRMIALTSLYMQLATTDPVLRLMAKRGPIDGVVQTFPITSTGDSRGDPLPMMTFSAISSTPARAHGLARRHIDAFLEFLRRDQVAKGIQPDERIQVDIVRQPQAPVLLMPRKKTRPIIVFLTVAIATFGLAFILENLRPRVRALPETAKATVRAPRARGRRTA